MTHYTSVGRKTQTRPKPEDLQRQKPEVDLPMRYNANVLYKPRSSKPYLAAKRTIDILGAITGLVLFLPVIVVTALLIKLSDGGPVLFRQQRVGEKGKLFWLFKFRSMHINAEAKKVDLLQNNQHSDNRTFKILHDPRITTIGRFIRRLSIDEVPQFWNVLRGDMSLVGPRPALPAEVVLYGEKDYVRLAVKPGLTCIWQVSGRSNLAFEQQIELDMQYIMKRNTFLDVKLLVMTPLAVVRGDGAA